jgi:hypothetical protein
MKLNVKVDLSGVTTTLAKVRDEYQKAVARALNKTATTARAQASREIREVGYGLKAGTIKDALNIRRATPGNLTAVITASSKPIPLIEFNARQTKSGVTVSVLNGRQPVHGAFIATTQSGHRGVFVRVGNTHKRVVKNGRRISTGLPIKELYGPSVGNALTNKIVSQALVEAIKGRFDVVLKQELNYSELRR